MIRSDSITFGKYKGLSLTEMLRDRGYCEWFVGQPELCAKYEYISNRIREHLATTPFLSAPLTTLSAGMDPGDFIKVYPYFNLVVPEKLTVVLSDRDMACYRFYLKVLSELKEQVQKNFLEPYNIKAPKAWLQRFETDTGFSRDVLKEFLTAHGLPNITSVIEEIKKQGGIEYKGARAFKIAKANSEVQEKFWEEILKEFFGEGITVQHKFENCLFDFLYPDARILYECKLGLKDFDLDQFRKYNLALENSFKIVYLISTDCIVDLDKKKIYTVNPASYRNYFFKLKKPTKLDEVIQNFDIVQIKDVRDYFRSCK